MNNTIKKTLIRMFDMLGMGKNSYICGYHTIQDNLEKSLGDEYYVEEISGYGMDCKVFKISTGYLEDKPYYLFYHLDGSRVSSVEVEESI